MQRSTLARLVGRRGQGRRGARAGWLALRALARLLCQGSRAGLAFWARDRACWENQAPAMGSVRRELVWRLQSGSKVWKVALEALGQPAMDGVSAASSQVRTPPAASHWPHAIPGALSHWWASVRGTTS